MGRTLRILVLEDLPEDAGLMVDELRQANIPLTYRQVNSREQFLAILHDEEPDLILSDFKLQSFDGLQALALAQAACPEVPFIFVSGATGEEVAIDAVKRGATDYVLKDRLSRLVPAVQRARREAAERRERHRAVAALKASEEKYRLLIKNIPAVVYKGYMDSTVDFVDDNKVRELTGYPKKEFDDRTLKWSDLLEPADRRKYKEAFLAGLKESRSFIREYRIRRKDGEVLWVQDQGQIICGPDGRAEYVNGVFFNITERCRAEEALRESESRFTSFMRHLPGVAVMRDLRGHYLYVNETWERVQRRKPQDWQGRSLEEVWPPETASNLKDSDRQVIAEGEPLQIIEEIPQEDGVHTWLVNKFPILDQDRQPILVGSVGIDITLRRRAEEALRASEQRLRFLTSQLLSAQERERKRISMELHDELGQNLALLKLQIRAIEKALRKDQQDLKESCRELLHYLDGVIDNIRRLSHDLSPAVLEDLGLQSALKYLINGVSQHYNVTYSFEVEDLDHLFPPESQIIIYRIFQECLTNIS
ncbi:MAG TPA: PAS domain S-box protein, partial [Desulfobaccales bacterium]|nr:PAS domain S-box protein [Desulfobaccales bacterium]